MTRIKTMIALALITCSGAFASPAWAADRDIAALNDLRAGDMRKLTFLEEATAAPNVAFLDETGTEMTLEAFAGKVVLLNFWATWCAPCRHEMPALNALQKELGGDRFAVVTIATGRNPPPAIAAFFKKAGVDALPAYRDPKQELARAAAIFGLPMTLVIDETGHEIARLRGDAAWDSADAKTLLRAIIGPDG